MSHFSTAEFTKIRLHRTAEGDPDIVTENS